MTVTVSLTSEGLLLATEPDHGDLVTESDSDRDEDSSGEESQVVSREVMSVADPSNLETSTVNLEPHQPKHAHFPSVRYDQQLRSFQPGWFAKWKWLEWDDMNKCAFCHPCKMATNLKFNLSKKAEGAFSTQGFQNWKDPTRCVGD